MAKKVIMAKKSRATSLSPKSLLKEARWVVKNRWALLSTIPNATHYEMQERIINILFSKFPTNTNIHEVITKVNLLNLTYSTHVTAISLLANDIMKLHNIDARLAAGDKTLVPAIAKAGSPAKIFRSFATKYCACHNPKAYPIYDRIVREYLAKVISKGNLPLYSGSVNTILTKMENSYAYYVDVYDAFMKTYHLTTMTYRQVDWYIWAAHKSKTSAHLSHLDLFKLV